MSRALTRLCNLEKVLGAGDPKALFIFPEQGESHQEAFARCGGQGEARYVLFIDIHSPARQQPNDLESQIEAELKQIEEKYGINRTKAQILAGLAP
jgi:hypothetical protein